MARTNLKIISVYLDEGEYKKVAKASGLESRSMSNWIRVVITEAANEVIADSKPSRK